MIKQDETIKDDSPAEEIIDLRQYFNVINKYKWRIFILATLSSILAAIITMNMTPIFRSTATLLIEAKQTKAVSFEEIVGLDSNQKEYYLTQFEILKSTEITRDVIESLNLKQHADFIPKESLLGSIKKSLPFMPKNDKNENVGLSAEEIIEFEMLALIKGFAGRLTITPVRKTQLVKISYESSDSKMAALVANTVGETYINRDLKTRLGVSQKASGWLTSRLSDLAVRLKASEEKLQLYREKENLVDIEGVLSLATKELEQTSEQLVIARNDVNNLESIMRVVNEYGRDNIEMLESMTEITSHRVIDDVKKSLVQVERKVSELAEVFGPRHPKMISARAELATVKKNLSSQVRRLVTGIEKESKTSRRNVIALEKELKGIRAEYQVLTRKSTEYRQLSRDVQTNRQIYDTFLSRSKETEVTSDFNSAIARFTDRAMRAKIPVKPKKHLIVGLVFVLFIGLGVVIAFIYDTLNDTFKSAKEVENRLAQRMLGLLPAIPLPKGEGLSSHHFFDKNDKKFAESVRTIRTSFVLTQMEKDTKIIEVTSSVPGEGKSTIAMNLAYSLGQMEKTLLIDADMRRPSLGKMFDLPAYHPGLANLIGDTEQFPRCIHKDRVSQLTVMPCGQIPSNPLELLSTKRFAKILEALKKNFTYIIIDTPPINAVSDALVIAPHTDTLIYVVKSDDTRVGLVQNCIARLVAIKANISGIVLNQVDTKKLSPDGYYHGYYDSYSYGDNKESEAEQKS